MDYQVFLVSRMREDYLGGEDAQGGIVAGFLHSSRVVAAAATIMIAVFAGFFLTDDPIIKSVGFALAFGVAVDAFVVRMTIIPAAMAWAGDRAWRLPAALDRLIPIVDVEGHQAPEDQAKDPIAEATLTH
jgi:RND superfamily putative drug exporter